GHRDLRLPAPPLRKGRYAALPELRPSRGATERGPDRRYGPDLGTGYAARGHGAARARAEGRVPRAVQIGPQAGVHSRDRRWGVDRGGRPPEAQPAAEPQRVGGRRPPRRPCRGPGATGRFDRDG